MVLSLDYRHLAAFTDHIVPTQADYVYEADASTGNYAYMVDNKGLIISHPLDYHIEGLNPDGTAVQPLTKDTAEALTKEGKEVLNLNLLGFMDPGLPEVAKEAAAGKAGFKNYKFAGRDKYVAYAPIKYFAKAYPEPAGFGWIGMGVDIAKFQEMATATAEKINQEVKGWTIDDCHHHHRCRDSAVRDLGPAGPGHRSLSRHRSSCRSGGCERRPL